MWRLGRTLDSHPTNMSGGWRMHITTWRRHIATHHAYNAKAMNRRESPKEKPMANTMAGDAMNRRAQPEGEADGTVARDEEPEGL